MKPTEADLIFWGAMDRLRGLVFAAVALAESVPYGHADIPRYGSRTVGRDCACRPGIEIRKRCIFGKNSSFLKKMSDPKKRLQEEEERRSKKCFHREVLRKSRGEEDPISNCQNSTLFEPPLTTLN